MVNRDDKEHDATTLAPNDCSIVMFASKNTSQDLPMVNRDDKEHDATTLAPNDYNIVMFASKKTRRTNGKQG